MGSETSTLAGRKVLLARDPTRAREWAEPLEARGAVVVSREVSRLESMVGEARAQRSLDVITTWDWILFTSQNGLRFFRRGLQARGAAWSEIDARFGVVGPRTAVALEDLGREVAAIADPPNGEGLARVLENRIREGERILIVRPEQTTPGLAEALERFGAEVASVPYYRNRPARGIAAVAAELSDGTFDAAVFGAPSSFRHLYAACGERAIERLRWVALVAIGRTTAGAIREHGCEVAAVAPEPTPEGIARAVQGALSG